MTNTGAILRYLRRRKMQHKRWIAYNEKQFPDDKTGIQMAKAALKDTEAVTYAIISHDIACCGRIARRYAR